MLGIDGLEQMLEKAQKVIKKAELIEDIAFGNKEEKTKAELEAVKEILDKIMKMFKAEKIDTDEIFSFGGAIALIDDLIDEYAESVNLEELEFATYSPHPEYPTVSLAGLPKMLKGGPPEIFSKKKNLRLVKLLVETELGFAQKQSMPKAQKYFDEGEQEKGYEAIFTASHLTKLKLLPRPFDFVPEPEWVVNNWQTDEEHGRQFLNGVNPVMIRLAKDLEDLSEQIVKKLGKDELQKLIDQDRLLYVSFDDLEELKKNPHSAYPAELNPNDGPLKTEEWRYFDAAIAVFFLSKDRKILKTEAIQLERKPDAKVYTNTNGENKAEWLYAKARLATADSNYHEWVSHLGMTHLATEPHIIAAYNTLRKKNHKLYIFLEPLYKDTLTLNWAARKTLAEFGPDSWGDQMSSVGVGQYLQLLLKKWEKYDFFDAGLPTELESRGFTKDIDMPCYLFRDDGMKLWHAMGNFAMEFVGECYKTDAELANDDVVQEWARETSYADKGAVPGFPTAFTDKITLAKAIQTIMWMTSGQHAAINFPQYDFYSYAPNKPLGARASLEAFPHHKPEKEQRKWIFANYFPNMDATKHFQILTTKVLTLPSTHTIGKMDSEFTGVGATAYKNFQKELKGIGKEISERNLKNKKNKLPIYHYLHPDVVPASIDI